MGNMSRELLKDIYLLLFWETKRQWTLGMDVLDPDISALRDTDGWDITSAKSVDDDLAPQMEFVSSLGNCSPGVGVCPSWQIPKSNKY